MELLLWRWSTAVQVTSVLTITAFFLVLSRSIRRAELRPWVQAWVANFGALAVTSLFWFLQPSPSLFVLLRGSYFFAKTMFALLLLLGATIFVRDVFAPVKRLPIVIAALLYSTVAAILLDTIDLIGVVQSTVLCILFAAAALRLLGASGKALGWLCAGLGIRSLLALGEAVAYGMRIRGNGAAAGSAVGIYLSAQSSFDTAAEWLIALGCVLALYHRIQSELIAANGELTAAQQVLQQLADHDPLTGLANRRSVPAALAQAYGTGATILFFDLDDFKEINDRYGHHAGDEALRRFARAAQECFRPGDDVIRYAGDEFVVIARSIEPAALVDRIDALQRRLHESGTEGPPIGFSVGWSYLPVGGEADQALKSADEAMYRQKFARRERQERHAG